ncbi:MAG: outer membrane protein assembly factor BamA [Acidobacteriota bacterium]
MIYRFSVALLGVLLFCIFTLTQNLLAAAQQESPERIEDVRIVGNRRITEESIRFYIQTRQNDPYDQQQILRDYRNLLNTDFFVDASVKTQEGETGTIVIFEVTERPLIREIEYQGMTSFKESDVLERFRDMKVGMTVDSAFNESKLPQARKAIQMLLEMNGRPLGRVEVETEEITSYALKVIFKIDEGPKVRIGDISFEGNTVFEDDELQGALELTKERGPITLFKGHDKYIEEKLEYDVQMNLLAKYRDRGYINAKAGEPEVQIVEAPQGLLLGFRKTKQQYYISIPIEEGEQFRYGTFEVDGITTFDQEAIKRGLYNVVPGEIVNWTALKEANDELKKYYSRYGYLDMEAFPEWDVSNEGKILNIKIQVDEGKQYLVDRITFAGNTKTRDKVLRREFFLEEQRMFNGDLLDYSVLRLNQLGFFEKVEEKDYEVIKKPEESSVDVLVKVKERSQQSIGLTGGVSGISGSFVGINYQSNNFRGLGQQIDVQLLTGTRTSNYMFRFTEPYFMDSRLSLGWSVFNQRYRFDTYSLYFGLISPSNNVQLFTRHSTGFDVSGSYPLGRFSRAGLTYGLSSIKITDVHESFQSASTQLQLFAPGGNPEEALKGLIRSEVTPSYTYNTKNQYFGATQGSYFIGSMAISGGPLGGTFNILRPYAEYQKFFSDRWLSGGRSSFAFRAQLQHILPYGNLSDGSPMGIPFFERIFSGGEYTLRGFDIRQVSPWAISRAPQLDSDRNPIIDPATGLPLISENPIPIGGDTGVVLTAEYRMPLVGPLQVVGFVDFGTSLILRKDNLQLFGPDTFIDLQEQTNNVWRMSTGAEVQFLLPVINQPFRLIFAYNPLVLDTDIVVNGVRFPDFKEPRSNVRFTVGYTF